MSPQGFKKLVLTTVATLALAASGQTIADDSISPKTITVKIVQVAPEDLGDYCVARVRVKGCHKRSGGLTTVYIPVIHGFADHETLLVLGREIYTEILASAEFKQEDLIVEENVPRAFVQTITVRIVQVPPKDLHDYYCTAGLGCHWEVGSINVIYLPTIHGFTDHINLQTLGHEVYHDLGHHH